MTTQYHAIQHENFTVIKFYGLPLNCLDKKLTIFNITEVQFQTLCYGNI